MKPFSQRSTQGSALIATVITTVLISAIIAATLPLTLSNSRLAMRESMSIAAFNLAEAGIERAVYDLHNDPQLSAWVASGNYLTRTLTDQSFGTPSSWGGLGEGQSFQIRLVMEDPMIHDKITILSQAEVIPPASRGAPIRQTVELKVAIRHLGGNSPGLNGPFPHVGFVTTGLGLDPNTNSMILNGRSPFRSYNSNLPVAGTYNPPAIGSNDGEEITIGAANGKMELRNAQVYGAVATWAPVSAGYVNSNGSFMSTKGLKTNQFKDDSGNPQTFSLVQHPNAPTHIPPSSGF